jgi:hypothetical protein
MTDILNSIPRIDKFLIVAVIILWVWAIATLRDHD